MKEHQVSSLLFFLTHLDVQCICSPTPSLKILVPIISLHHFFLPWFSSRCLHFCTQSLHVVFNISRFSFSELIPLLLPSFVSTQLPLWFPTAPLLWGCQIKVKIFFRVLSSALLLLFFYTHHLKTIDFSS